MLHVLQPTFKPVLQQTRLLQVARILIFDWIKNLSYSKLGCCKLREY